MTNLGADFKKARESKGISLDQIATETRIRIRFLTAIENEAFHLLPGGIFNRGFVRTYAERVGIDPDEAVTDYERLAEVREPAEAPAKIERHQHPVAVGALILLIVIFYVVTRESGNTAQTASAPPAPISQPAALPPPPTTAPETTSVATTPEPEPAPPATKEALAIEMEAKETTWIKVTADGNSVNPGEILKRGMTRRFTAQFGHIKVNDSASFMRQHNEYKKHAQSSSRYREEVDRHEIAGVIIEEGSPRLGRRGAAFWHESGNGTFGNLNAQFLQFPMKSRRAPAYIAFGHRLNQFADIGSGPRTSWIGVLG